MSKEPHGSNCRVSLDKRFFLILIQTLKKIVKMEVQEKHTLGFFHWTGGAYVFFLSNNQATKRGENKDMIV